ncbi:hypothetical protein [Caldiplasma sukawensis]
MSSTKIFLKLEVLSGLILMFSYIFWIDEHVPSIFRPEYNNLISLIAILTLFAIFITFIYAVIDLEDHNRKFGTKRI